MNITINTMERKADNGGVVTVHWSTSKTSGEHTASQYGTESFEPDPATADFKPFDQLTEADVQQWLRDRWGVDGMAAKEAALDAQLTNLVNPPVIAGVPWSV